MSKVFYEHKHQNLIIIDNEMFYKNSTGTIINIKDPLFQYVMTTINIEPNRSPSTHITNIFLIPEISDIVTNYIDNLTNKPCGHVCDNYSTVCCECDDKRDIQWINGVSICKNKKYIDGSGEKIFTNFRVLIIVGVAILDL